MFLKINKNFQLVIKKIFHIKSIFDNKFINIILIKFFLKILNYI